MDSNGTGNIAVGVGTMVAANQGFGWLIPKFAAQGVDLAAVLSNPSAADWSGVMLAAQHILLGVQPAVQGAAQSWLPGAAAALKATVMAMGASYGS